MVVHQQFNEALASGFLLQKCTRALGTFLLKSKIKENNKSKYRYLDEVFLLKVIK